jgi:hypothetical protein
MSTDLIQPKHSLLSDKRFEVIKDIILKRLQEFQNTGKYKFDNEFLSLACSLIEHLVKKEDKLNKKELLLQVYDVLFPSMSFEDKQQISNNIEFLLNNHQIKKVSNYKLFKAGVIEWISKKFL